VREHFSSGVRSGVNGTPCLFINGQRWEGPAEADVLIPSLNELVGK
jgi:protein-disulfide isomerase